MLTVGIKELKAKLSSYVEKVSAGEEVVVTDHGREVARASFRFHGSGRQCES